jgi:2'-5' RNA ligase
VRLFIAIDLSKDLREKLSNQILELSNLLRASSIKWVRPSGVHLTLKFLGETPENQVDNIRGTLGEIAPKYSSFNIQLGGFGCFPNIRKPRVLWIGVYEPEGILKLLHQDIESGFQKLGFKKEGRPFKGHLTLGRIRKGLSSSELKRLSGQVNEIQIGTLGIENVKELCLFRSVLHPSGAEYTKLGVFKFSGAE